MLSQFQKKIDDIKNKVNQAKSLSSHFIEMMPDVESEIFLHISSLFQKIKNHSVGNVVTSEQFLSLESKLNQKHYKLSIYDFKLCEFILFYDLIIQQVASTKNLAIINQQIQKKQKEQLANASLGAAVFTQNYDSDAVGSNPGWHPDGRFFDSSSTNTAAVINTDSVSASNSMEIRGSSNGYTLHAWRDYNGLSSDGVQPVTVSFDFKINLKKFMS